MIDDWMDPRDPLNPLHPFFWADWVCPDCAEDGAAGELVEGDQCPHCGATVEAV